MGIPILVRRHLYIVFFSCQVECFYSRRRVLASSRSATILSVVLGGSLIWPCCWLGSSILWWSTLVSAMVSSSEKSVLGFKITLFGKRIKMEYVHCKLQDASPYQQPDLRVTQSLSQWLVWAMQIFYIDLIFCVRNSGCCSILVGWSTLCTLN